MASPYELNGYGSKTKKADSDLKKKESELIGRLKDAEVDTSLSVSKTVYSADYSGKEAKQDDLVCPKFLIQSQEGWDHLAQEAQTRANGGSLRSYDVEFTLRRTYKLTSKQMHAATRRHTTSTPAEPNASPYNISSSYLEALTS